LIAAGLILQTTALAWMALVITPTMSYWSILPPFVIFGIGMGLFFPPVAYIVLGSVPREAAGQASGANNAIRELGGVFGVGVLATIFATYGSYRSGQAYTDGLIPAVWVGTAVVALGAAASLFIPGRKHAVREVDATVLDAPEQRPSAPAAAAPPPPSFPLSETLEPVWNVQPDHHHEQQHEQQPETFACPVCMGHGWFPFEPPQDPRTQTCPRCYGHGKVLTGSHVEGHILHECPECEAQGYVELQGERVSVTATKAAPSRWPGSESDSEQEVWRAPAGQSPPSPGAPSG
jgi:hypothetical protein